MKIVPFEAVHLSMLIPQDAQASASPHFKPEYAAALEKTEAYTAIDNGEVVACAGLVEYWPGRAMLWSYLSKNIGHRIIGVHKATKRLLAIAPYERIEAEVDCDFAEGHRWMKLLGFECEAPRMRKAQMGGADAALYARVK